MKNTSKSVPKLIHALPFLLKYPKEEEINYLSHISVIIRLGHVITFSFFLPYAIPQLMKVKQVKLRNMRNYIKDLLMSRDSTSTEAAITHWIACSLTVPNREGCYSHQDIIYSFQQTIPKLLQKNKGFQLHLSGISSLHSIT